ncbi:MAG: hypothetical protein KKD63_05995 [Proteobacteria bacterium]|nr:hypothetical protein [Desulfobulbaceae bacterium]MBU4152411.1 hypothetical protein [Pseudomonadota bacterium]
MTEITSTKLQSGFTKAQQDKSLEKTSPKKTSGADADQEELQAAAVEIQSQRLDLLLSVKSEANTAFTWQKGLQKRAADQGVDLSTLQYQGKPITDLSQGEAAALVAEDGYFGVTKTSQRLADFVINGGGEDLKKLQAGREGIIRGFKEAEKIWGGELPEISHQTLAKALELIDSRIRDLGGGVMVDVRA